MDGPGTPGRSRQTSPTKDRGSAMIQIHPHLAGERQREMLAHRKNTTVSTKRIMQRSRRLTWAGAAGAAALSLLAAACGSSGSSTPSAPSPPAINTATSSPALDVEAIINKVLHERNGFSKGEGSVDGSVFSDSNSGGTDINATVDYMTAAIQDIDQVWSNWFQQNNLNAPAVAYEIIQAGQTFNATPTCADIHGNYIFASNYENAFYCSADDTVAGYVGTIILPADTFSKMWAGDIFTRQVSSLGRTGDFAAAVIEAHEYGHKVQDELSTDFNVPAPSDPDKELLADCFAGNYSYSAFTRGYLSQNDVDVALSALGVIGDDVGSHGTGAQRENAFEIGYYGLQSNPVPGLPTNCISTYWPAFANG